MEIILPAGYNNSVFVNCPFDVEYTPILQAIIYTIFRCGFFPKSALMDDNALDYRLEKIVHLIAECRYGIHDISRTELCKNNLPRFNMPFEFGIFFGAKKFGPALQRNKNALVFERTKYLYQQYISDINGMDTKAHNNDVETAIRSVRDWLRAASKRTSLPSHTTIIKEYNEFQQKLTAILKSFDTTIDDISLNDYCTFVEEAVAAKLLK
jgi:hypothetical protein